MINPTRSLPGLVTLAACLLTSSGCLELASGTCQGMPRACSTFEDTVCASQDGCGNESRCEGTPDPCESMWTESFCAMITGCIWDDGACTGTPTPCVELGYDGCHRWGCAVGPFSCTGTATPCEHLEEELDCTSQEGCTWD